MATPSEEYQTRRALLEWCQHSSPHIQLRCITIAFNLARLAGDSDNLALRRETMGHITSLEDALRNTKTASQEVRLSKGVIRQILLTAAPRIKEPSAIRGHTAPSSDLRQRPRAARTRYQNWSAQIEVHGRQPVIASVWDVSPIGACLLVAPEYDLPDAFTINFDAIRRQAQVVWRRWSFLGVRFTDEVDPQDRDQFALVLKRAINRERRASGRRTERR